MHGGGFYCLTLSGTGQKYLYCRSKGSVLSEDAEDEQSACLDNNLQKKRKTSGVG
jgi:hypothetical protein